ncbi:MAG TPA: translation initiation factor IF-2 [Elusimicrobia bacterium]|jgi:translation initiation factor IF-2|nr:translation initiation factor IF-2 [Elusimicrobiota bacterium]
MDKKKATPKEKVEKPETVKTKLKKKIVKKVTKVTKPLKKVVPVKKTAKVVRKRIPKKQVVVTKPEKIVPSVKEKEKVVLPIPSAKEVIVPEKKVEPISLPPVKVKEIITPKIEPRKEIPRVEPVKPVIVKPKIKIDETTTTAQLAEKIGVKPVELIKKLLSLGSLVTINQRIDLDTATLVAGECGYEIEFVPLYGEETLSKEEVVDPSKLIPRAPVVTIMGHVDHGKTSLLDAIRQTRLAEKEYGGITQHIGAYKVKSVKGEIVFLDTPGHEAFTAMRARGAQVTDIVVLVVAADDGVMPQTIESIDHAKAADVPIIVAVNKIDLPTANSQKVKQELAQLGLIPEEWGGKTIFVEVSAKKQINLDKLLEMILLEAEILELKSNPTGLAQGIIIEARVDPRKGPLATVLIQKGTLRIGDSFLAGFSWGKVRALIDDRGRRLIEVLPTSPVELLGFNSAPEVGDRFFVLSDEREAKKIVEQRQQIRSQESISRGQHVTLDDFYRRVKEGKLKELKLILKADVQGSLEAIKDSLSKLTHPEIKLLIIHSGIGGINESDCLLAAASEAVIIGFNVRPELGAEKLAKDEGVDIRSYRIIYELIDEIKAAMEGLLEPGIQENILGRLTVRQIFRIPKIGIIAGCYVDEGKIIRGANVRLLRENTIIYDGRIISLRRFKEDVREVEKGYECGLGLENFQDLKIGDILEIYEKVEVARKLVLSK